MKKSNVLFIVHRIPYPPNKGDKISTHNMLKYFSARWRVHLGTFIDDPDDWQHLPVVNDMCEDTCILDLPRSKKVTGSIIGLLTGEWKGCHGRAVVILYAGTAILLLATCIIGLGSSMAAH